MNDAKQQIVEKIKASANILITVSTNPSVDELSSALGLTLLLNKLNKHATAVFSGAVPPAITFLQPEKTFENSIDSLRDFIIALDKEKADHLRYKVEGDVVKIFITPYRTTLSGDDLEFSQGDYNVELVLALGVTNQEHLDSALEAHGRILHDATVATVGIGEDKSSLGSIDWREKNGSSLGELLVSLADDLKSDKPLLDEQTATAFLTGIVAATDRFSNNKTSPAVMTIAAKLMAAGANQQLISSKLEEAHAIGAGSPNAAGENADGSVDLSEGESTKLDKKPAKKAKEEPKKDDGSLAISHESEGNLDQVAAAIAAANQDAAAKAAEQKLATQLATVAPAATGAAPSVADLQKDLAAANAEVTQAAQQPPASAAPLAGAVPSGAWQNADQVPSMGGTLNATTEQAAEESRRAVEDDRNRTILTHGGGNYVGNNPAPSFQSPLNSSVQPEEQPPVDPFAELPQGDANDTAQTTHAQSVQPPVGAASGPTLADLDKQNRAPHEDARAAVDAAFGAVPFNPAGIPEARVGAQNLGEVPHSSQPAATGLPPLPDFSTLPPLPPVPDFAAPAGGLSPEKLQEVLAPAPTASPGPNDPTQFKIPGQS